MAVPKRRVSKQRSRKRFASNFKVATPALAECSQCHELKANHQVCPKCGYYNGVKKVETEKAKKQ